MKIIALQDYLRVGGTERQFLDLTNRWAAMGHEVSRVVFRRGGPLWHFLPSEEKKKIAFLQPFPTPWNWWSPGLRKYVEKSRPDVIFCMGRNAHSAAARALLPEWGKTLVATHRTGRKLPNRYMRALREASLVIANSGYAAGKAREAGASSSKVHVIPNGCLLPVGIGSTESREALRAERGVGEDEIIFLCVGSFVPGKNQSTLLDLWDSLSDTVRRRSHLWFAGEGLHKKVCQQKACGFPDSDRIHFWGNIADPLPLYYASDVAVSTSQEESFPNFVVEAQWTGLPVLALDCAGLSEYVEEGVNGYLCENTSTGHERFIQIMENLHADATLRGRLGQEAEKKARQKFAPQELAGCYLELFANR